VNSVRVIELRYLDVTGECFKSLSSATRSLKALNFNVNLKKKSIQLIGERCPSLRRLAIRDGAYRENATFYDVFHKFAR